MLDKNTTRGSVIRRTIFLVTMAMVVCFIIASPFVIFGVNEAGAYNFSGSLGGLAKKVGLSPAVGKQNELPEIIGTVIYAGLSVIGVVCLLIISIAGFRWMMSGGSEETIAKAKQTIKNAAIGVIIVLASYTITYFVINALLAGGNP